MWPFGRRGCRTSRGRQALPPHAADPVVAAVRRWRFKPAFFDGRALETTTTVAVHVALVRTVVAR